MIISLILNYEVIWINISVFIWDLFLYILYIIYIYNNDDVRAEIREYIDKKKIYSKNKEER